MDHYGRRPGAQEPDKGGEGEWHLHWLCAAIEQVHCHCRQGGGDCKGVVHSKGGWGRYTRASCLHRAVALEWYII